MSISGTASSVRSSVGGFRIDSETPITLVKAVAPDLLFFISSFDTLLFLGKEMCDQCAMCSWALIMARMCIIAHGSLISRLPLAFFFCS